MCESSMKTVPSCATSCWIPQSTTKHSREISSEGSFVPENAVRVNARAFTKVQNRPLTSTFSSGVFALNRRSSAALLTESDANLEVRIYRLEARTLAQKRTRGAPTSCVRAQRSSHPRVLGTRVHSEKVTSRKLPSTLARADERGTGDEDIPASKQASTKMATDH